MWAPCFVICCGSSVVGTELLVIFLLLLSVTLINIIADNLLHFGRLEVLFFLFYIDFIYFGIMGHSG